MADFAPLAAPLDGMKETYVRMMTAGPILFKGKYHFFVCLWKDVGHFLEEFLEQDEVMVQSPTVTFQLMEMTGEEYQAYCDDNEIEF